MAEEQKEDRRTSKTRWEREKYAKLSAAEKAKRSKAGIDRHKNMSPEEKARTRALERQSWARRKRKADLARMSQPQRKLEDDRWTTLTFDQQEAENEHAFELHVRNTNAIDDLGTDTPGRAFSPAWSYARDKKVRDAVLRRAHGKCEFCGGIGFMTSSGKRYLESHHVIALADEGADRLTNVIALCPNDHREAHFGRRRVEMEREMILKLSAMSR